MRHSTLTAKRIFAKLEIALKEANETSYWLKLMFETNRIDDNHHTVFILSKTDEAVVVAECNACGMNDCKIARGRVIPRQS